MSSSEEKQIDIRSASVLPPKKRYCQKQEKEDENPVSESQSYEKRKKTAIPGVIRHTSSPDHSLAYFYWLLSTLQIDNKIIIK